MKRHISSVRDKCSPFLLISVPEYFWDSYELGLGIWIYIFDPIPFEFYLLFFLSLNSRDGVMWGYVVFPLRTSLYSGSRVRVLDNPFPFSLFLVLVSGLY